MASVKVPQYINADFEFADLSFNREPSEIDFDEVDDIRLSIASVNDLENPILTLRSSIVPSRFVIDNIAKSVLVSVLSSEIGTDVGFYKMNLWIEIDGNLYTHISRDFEMVYAVPPE